MDPKHHRRGVGTLMMQYGVGIADELGVDVRILGLSHLPRSHLLLELLTDSFSKAVVEASRVGRFLYEKFGFEILEDVLIPNPPKQQGQQEQFIHWMQRPAKPGKGGLASDVLPN